MISGPFEDPGQATYVRLSHNGLNRVFGERVRSESRKVIFRHSAECRNVRGKGGEWMVGDEESGIRGRAVFVLGGMR